MTLSRPPASTSVNRADGIGLTEFPVRLFVHWLYKGTIPKNGSDKEWSPILDRVINCTIKKRHLNLHTRELFPLLIKAYIFGDRFLAIGFRRDISERISDNLSRIRLWGTTFQQVIQHAFTHIPFDRPILQHLADICCKDWYEDEDEEADIFAQKDLPQAFIMRVLRRFGEVREMKQMNIQSHVRCYYEHASEEDEKRCGKAHMVYNEKRDYGYFPSG